MPPKIKSQGGNSFVAVFVRLSIFFGKIPSGSGSSYIAKVGLLKLTIVSLFYSDNDIYIYYLRLQGVWLFFVFLAIVVDCCF